jgi:hypothetical protein
MSFERQTYAQTIKITYLNNSIIFYSETFYSVEVLYLCVEDTHLVLEFFKETLLNRTETTYIFFN